MVHGLFIALVRKHPEKLPDYLKRSAGSAATFLAFEPKESLKNRFDARPRDERECRNVHLALFDQVPASCGVGSPGSSRSC